jgi:hypothetical protein
VPLSDLANGSSGQEAAEIEVAAQLEFRCSNDEVALYGTREGLMRLAQLCTEVANGPTQNGSAHLHLEDSDLLTPKSLRAVIAVFDEPPAV